MEFLALKVGKPRPTSVVRGGITQSLESKEGVSLDSIGTLANGLELHRYGLICWVEGDEYEIIER